jgi:U3 small nucleolar RNA-associated protein 10
VERLALGCALGALDTFGQPLRSEQSLALFQELVESGIFGESCAATAVLALLRLLRNIVPGSAEHGQLLDLVNRLVESASVLRTLQTVATANNMELEALGILLQHTLPIEAPEAVDSDEEMLDAAQASAQQASDSAIALPKLPQSTCFAVDTEPFHDVLAAFEQATTSGYVRRLLASKELKREEASDNPLFLSFLARVWCTSTMVAARLEAIRSATTVIREPSHSMDWQILVPYVLFALSDPSPIIRRAAAVLVGDLAKASASDSPRLRVWGASGFYGKQSSQTPTLKPGEASQFLSSVLVPILEESVLDSTVAVRSVKESLEGSKPSKHQSGQGLKSTLRNSVLAFLSSHVAITPLIQVRTRLLPLFQTPSKHVAGIRANTIIPVLRTWCTVPSAEAAAVCAMGSTDKHTVDCAHLDALVPREAESVQFLQDIISGNIRTDRLDLLSLAFDRLRTIWPSLRSDSRLSLSQCLLELALREKCITTDDELRRSQALEALRAIKLDTTILLEFIESIPNALQMPEGPPAKKRRRSSRNEMVRAEMQSPEDVSKLLRRTTIVLELIEASQPAEHPVLLKNLFGILGDIQQLRHQSGSDLVYLQSLVLGSLTPIVNELKVRRLTHLSSSAHTLQDRQSTAEYQSAVRADLLVDCIRHSTSPQVQNAALLLIASLASWVPELVLHNLMPIFTFLGSTLLRQGDDYSAHVVDQTISRVVPQLAESLRKRDKNLVTGVADLLLSFTAAFEHVPLHRRLKLFSELARTLGPEDSLSAIIALLIDRYPTSSEPRKFIPGLLLKFEPVITLEAFKGYLALVTDGSGAKRKVADTLFSLNEKQPAQIDNSLNHLLKSLADLAADQTIRSHINKAFRRSRDPSRPRAVFADIIASLIQLSKQVAGAPKLNESCRRVLTKCLDLLPTIDLVKSAELLLGNSDAKVQVAAVRSVELRAGSVIQNDQQSVACMLSFLLQADALLQRTQDIDVKAVTISCIDRIVERFGKKDVPAVEAVARTVAAAQALASKEDRVRILSLLCITSIVDVLEEEAISLLPTVLPIAFDYLKESIERENQGLHNAVFALLTNIVDRLAFMFTREYLVPALELAQSSAESDLGGGCDEARRTFYQSLSVHLEAQEAFASLKVTWPSSLAHGFLAAHEMLELILSTIEGQPKSKMIKASSTLFSLLLDAFNIRASINAGIDKVLKHHELEQLESSLIEAVIAMTLKLNDSLFRPFFVQLAEFASSSSKQNKGHSVTFFKFLAAFFERFKVCPSPGSPTLEH